MTPTTSLTWPGITARRMARSRLIEPDADASPARIAELLCGVHAQVLSAAELSIARRLADATRTDVQRALWDERSLVKTFGPRGTVHLFAASDLAMWTGAMSALPASVPRHPDPVRFTADQSEEVIAAIADALAAGPLTIDELTAALARHPGRWAVEETMDAFQTKWPRWRQLTSTAAHRGVLCFGPNRGRHATYANPASWLPDFRPSASAPAVRALLTRYLTAYGPATPEHMARWLAIPSWHARELFEAHADALDVVDFEGERSWIVAGDTAAPAEPVRGVTLLPYFDAYVIAGQPRERLFPGIAATRALAGGQAGNFPVLLVDGVVGGVWHPRRSGRRVEITVEPFSRLTKARRSDLDKEAAIVGRVLEATPTLTIGPVTVGAHA